MTNPAARRHRRSTIRARLAVFYGVVFGFCGILLLVVSYALVRESLGRDERSASTRVAESYGYQQEQIDALVNVPVAPPSGRDARTVGDVLAGVQSDIRADTLHALVVGTGFAVAGTVLVAVAVGWVASGRALRPVARITAHARRISDDNLSERLALQGPDDELKELADTIDGMLARLDASLTAERRFAANVSHELRTPLSVMRAEADLVLHAPDAGERELHLARSVTDATARAEALLESLLRLARSESTMRDRHPVDIAELTGDLVGDRLAAVDAAGVHLDLELGSAMVSGDKWLLEGLIANLIDNGINHNTAGGWLHLQVDTEGDDVVLRVTNSGDRLTDEQVADILKPFRRAGTRQRPGYGIGMTIIQSVVRAHQGTVTVRARSGGGLDVTATLPTEGRRAALAGSVLDAVEPPDGNGVTDDGAGIEPARDRRAGDGADPGADPVVASVAASPIAAVEGGP